MYLQAFITSVHVEKQHQVSAACVWTWYINHFTPCVAFCNMHFSLDVMCMRFDHVSVWGSKSPTFKAARYPWGRLHHGLDSCSPVDGHLDCVQLFDMTGPHRTLLWVSPGKINFLSSGMAGWWGMCLLSFYRFHQTALWHGCIDRFTLSPAGDVGSHCSPLS